MADRKMRSAGITAAAALAVLESGTIFVVWLSFFVSLLNLPADASGKHLYQILPFTFMFLASAPPLIAVVGLRIGVGLFQLRGWARYAALAWAAVALLFCLAIIALRPFETFFFPERLATETEYVKQLLVISVLVLLLPISVWWLFYFRFKSVKAQFGHVEGGEAVRASQQQPA